MSDDTVPVELFIVVASALERAETELSQLTELEPPTPDGLQRALDERLALLDTLHRIKVAAAAGKTITPGRIDATYKAAIAKGRHDPYELPKYRIDADVLAQITDAHEVVARRVLSDREVDHALRGQVESGWAW